ncbi:MAG: hypothetical protein ABI647_04060 [Gemmatimonadota bacterium]
MTETMKASGTLPKFGYFVLQTRALDHRGTLELSGVLENLGTGEKHGFASEEELIQLVRDWGWSGRDAGR